MYLNTYDLKQYPTMNLAEGYKKLLVKKREIRDREEIQNIDKLCEMILKEIRSRRKKGD